MLDSLTLSPCLKNFQRHLVDKENLLIEGLWDSPFSLLAAYTASILKKKILIVTSMSKESRLYDDLPLFYQGNVREFPSLETLPIEGIPPSPDIVGVRFELLYDLLTNSDPCIILADVQSVLQTLLPPKKIIDLTLNLSIGIELNFESIIESLVKMGYERKPIVTEKGEFSVRGGLIDIFSVSSCEPFRIEFFSEEIESIRKFDPVGQKSIGMLPSCQIFPAKEQELLQEDEKQVTILDFLGPDSLVILDRPNLLRKKYNDIAKLPDAPIPHFLHLDEFFSYCEPLRKLVFIDNEENIDPTHQAFSNLILWDHDFRRLNQRLLSSKVIKKHNQEEAIINLLPEFSDPEQRVIFLCSLDSEESHLKELFKNTGVSLPKLAEFQQGYLSSGIVLNDIKTALIPYTEISHRYKIRRQKQRSTYHSTPIKGMDLLSGDYVVHIQHGIGKYIGIERKLDHNGIKIEFLLIEYADQAKLFVPFMHLHLLSKYVGAKHVMPKLHALGGKRWTKTKVQTERAILDYASDLLELYAKRKISEGFEFPKDQQELIQFENEFPYEETPDQNEAINSVKQDMQSPKPMDRLICGDVGYGKTEVALRATFKAVMEGGKQVALLVPTTVLALQHYETFLARLENYPIEIAHLSRFISAKEGRKIRENLKKGKVDILIGTHRIISKDVSFHNLGLIIIDEEQRFGVKAKEHLKKMKTGVDSLTLSATPIPRTLYMSLMGARDLSLINTPPQDRLPIKTMIVETDDDLIRRALLRELSRDGQAFIIHNRVAGIFSFAKKIAKLVPDAKIVVGHGHMSSEELDEVFRSFKSGEADILVSTTIVENGIDIPNANTILIDRSDCFGLADLYQLRGRVGRWNKRAYAYFLTPKGRAVTEVAQKRLGVLLEAGGYGGGMKIALRDLEIRGGGEILGVEQSGHISSIGFHLYCKLLKQTILVLQGKALKVICEIKMEFPQDAGLPEEYINATELRMEIYQRLGEALNKETVDQLFEEIKDRFGPLPKPAIWLFHLTRIKLYAADNKIIFLKFKNKILIAEQRQRKSNITRKIVIDKPISIKNFDKVIIHALKENFLDRRRTHNLF